LCPVRPRIAREGHPDHLPEESHWQPPLGPLESQETTRSIMSQAIIDPEEVRRFAAELKRFNGDLRERTASLMARFTALGDTWQDQEQEKFAGEFTQLMKSLRSFIEVSDRHTPYLLRKAERIQHYLDQR
jgi:uncharacterized protein YukE